MAYPRRCPLCGADYRRNKAYDLQHTTARSEPGGTPSHARPWLPGRVLTLRCSACRAEYGWDYFAGQPAAAARKAG